MVVRTMKWWWYIQLLSTQVLLRSSSLIRNSNCAASFVVQGLSIETTTNFKRSGLDIRTNVPHKLRYSLRLERNSKHYVGKRRQSAAKDLNTVTLRSSTADTDTSITRNSPSYEYKEGSQDNRNVKDDALVFLSRGTEIASTIIEAGSPLLLSAIQIALRSNNGGANNERGNNTITNNISEENPDIWDTFWSSSGAYTTITNAQRVVSAMEKLGPTYVKFGQALASRPDIIPPSLAMTLSTLQDEMVSFDTSTAKSIIKEELSNTSNVDQLLKSLSDEPIAAASVGQVYKGYIEGVGPVAVKVQRPGIRDLVARDTVLLRNLALLLESIPSPSSMLGQKDDSTRFISTELVAAVDEFMSRIVEELDYSNEANNAETFARLYSSRGGTACKTLPNREGVIVPEIYKGLCTKNVIVMEWVEGTKLTAINDREANTNKPDSMLEGMTEKELVSENLALIEKALHVTLSQLLDTGVMHADPHAGNLLKVSHNGKKSLAYLDFGLLATIPSSVRDALVCAVAYLIFEKDVEAVAKLFGELGLLPSTVMADPVERAALTDALTKTMGEILQYPSGDNLFAQPSSDGNRASAVAVAEETKIPIMRFDKLLDGLVRLVPRFQFQLPPYFINNTRALGTLEGIARSLDPKFNCLQLMYPYAVLRLMKNPTGSPVVESTLQSLIRSKDTGRISRRKVLNLMRDTSRLTGYNRGKVIWDILKTKGGKKLALQCLLAELRNSLVFLRGLRRITRRRV